MEVILPRVMIVNLFLILFCFSCAAQQDINGEEDIVYSLIDQHYNIKNSYSKRKFLYYKTISLEDYSPLSLAKEMGLSEFLMDSIFIRNCRIIETIFLPSQIEEINNKFSNLESKVLKEEKLAASILNNKFLNQETYVKAPEEANRKISYPIIIKINQSIYSLFVEDAHNEGGRLFIYELEGQKWKVICVDSLWLI